MSPAAQPPTSHGTCIEMGWDGMGWDAPRFHIPRRHPMDGEVPCAYCIVLYEMTPLLPCTARILIKNQSAVRPEALLYCRRGPAGRICGQLAVRSRAPSTIWEGKKGMLRAMRPTVVGGTESSGPRLAERWPLLCDGRAVLACKRSHARERSVRWRACTRCRDTKCCCVTVSHLRSWSSGGRLSLEYKVSPRSHYYRWCRP